MMEMWQQVVLTSAVTILGIAVTLHLTNRALARYIGEAVRAIHDDITHSQAKLEGKIGKKKGGAERSRV